MAARFRNDTGQRRIKFHRIRRQTRRRWAIWRYLALLIIFLFLLKFLRSF
ncbi:MAG: hypothetical protein V3W14_09990 [Candidatus Neomarinimicrobiota bacterium]